MTRRTRRNHTPAFKAKVALGGHQGREDAGGAGAALSMCTRTRSRPGRRSCWRARRGCSARCGGAGGGAGGGSEDAARQDRGADAGERFFGRRAQQGRPAERKAMIDRDARPAADAAGGGSEAQPGQPLLPASAGVGRPIWRSCGGSTSCIWTTRSRAAGCCAICCAARASRSAGERVATMMRRMGIEAIYRRPNTSKPAPGHKIYPYLLRGVTVERPNQVWAMDITYIPMARGFVYLAAVVDWFSRRVLAWRLSITMEVDFCLEAVEEALARHGRPEIFNTDQGSQFTSAAFTGLLLDNAIAISMDGKGRVARQRLRRAAVAVGQIRGGLPARLRQRRPRRAPRSAGIWTSTIASGRIRALTRGRRITPTSTTSAAGGRRHEFRRRCRGVTPVGLRPPCVTPRQRQTQPTGRGSTYRSRNAVQTNPATSGEGRYGLRD